MAKIKWTEKDEANLKKAVRRFNQAVKKFEKENPQYQDSYVVPEKMSYAKVKKEILSRDEYNRMLKRMDRFTQPGEQDIVLSASGLYTTKWAQTNVMQDIRRAQQQRKKELNARLSKYPQVSMEITREIEAYDSDYKKEQMRIREAILEGKDIHNEEQLLRNQEFFARVSGNKEWQDERDIRYLTNWLKAAENTMTKEQYERIEALVASSDITGREIYLMSLMDDELHLSYHYTEDDHIAHYEYLKDRIPQLLSEIRDT